MPNQSQIITCFLQIYWWKIIPLTVIAGESLPEITVMHSSTLAHESLSEEALQLVAAASLLSFKARGDQFDQLLVRSSMVEISN